MDSPGRYWWPLRGVTRDFKLQVLLEFNIDIEVEVSSPHENHAITQSCEFWLKSMKGNFHSVPSGFFPSTMYPFPFLPILGFPEPVLLDSPWHIWKQTSTTWTHSTLAVAGCEMGQRASLLFIFICHPVFPTCLFKACSGWRSTEVHGVS